MPFKTVAQHRAYVKNHKRENKARYKEWNRQYEERRKAKPEYMEAQRKKEEARTARMDAASLRRDLKLLDRAIAYIRRQAIKRERPHVCRMCGAVVQDADWTAKAGHKQCALIKQRTHPKAKEYRKNKNDRIMADPSRRMIKNLRARHRLAFKHFTQGHRKQGHTLEYLGCTAAQFTEHIQSKLLDGMTLDNYGAWHIDHIIPVSSFNLRQKAEIRKAFHYTNTQPLWASDNIKKGCRLAPPRQMGPWKLPFETNPAGRSMPKKSSNERGN
jgi:hypothetical protein